MTTAYLGATAKAITHHYDVSNEFFGLWLDESRTYTCALWEPGDTLERAQQRKLDYLLNGARASIAERLLDVGCGWGSALRRAGYGYGVRQPIGLTLSPSQAEWVRDQAQPPGLDVRVENWIDHRPDAPYDAIVSIGAFEHFARFDLPRVERMRAYRSFFEFCRESMRQPGNRLALQTNVKGNNNRMDRQTVRDMMFIIETIFPESVLPTMTELVEASENLFEVVSVRNDPDHYVSTLQEWLRRLKRNRSEAIAIVGPEVVADYERYLSAAAEQFQRRHLGLARVIYEAV
ncbi:cyclopropane-fatty-acyl-phospholipid synthase family protein [Micromonospora sp. NPDC049101]|uniref:cyclopropane-fatty-acyl-phospholipid synthase family protein n=1 Tax=unclassified Micromonospora TaxID=2617518 RepID=UPI0034068B99